LISPNTLTITYIPLADIGTALGSAVKYDAGRNRYTVQPSEGGILKLNPEHAGIIIDDRPAPAAEAGIIIDDRPAPAAEAGIIIDDRPAPAAEAGIIIDDRPAPVAEGQRVSPTARVMRRPQQPAGQPAVPEAMSFAIGDQLVSKGIVIINGLPHMPLDDLAAATGTIIQHRPSPEGGGTVPVLVPQQGVTGGGAERYVKQRRDPA
jgi:hypothetical protein